MNLRVVPTAILGLFVTVVALASCVRSSPTPTEATPAVASRPPSTTAPPSTTTPIRTAPPNATAATPKAAIPASAPSASLPAATAASPALTEASPGTVRVVPPDPNCPCNESVATYRGRARKAAARGDWLMAWKWLRAAVHGRDPEPDILAEMAYVALRAGASSEALSLNRDAFWQTSDAELQATILFNQGLALEHEERGLEAALAFARSLEQSERAATRRHLARLPDPASVCEAPRSVLELCQCNAAERGRYLDVIAHEIEGCRQAGSAGAGRVLAIEQVLTAYERVDVVVSILLVEKRGDRIHPIRELASGVSPGMLGITGGATFDFFREQRVHGRHIITARASREAYDQNGGGIERFAETDTFDVVCLLAPELRCSDRVQVRATSYVHREENTAPDGAPENWTTVEDSMSFVQYGYTIAPDGTLTPKKLSGTLQLGEPPGVTRVW